MNLKLIFMMYYLFQRDCVGVVLSDNACNIYKLQIPSQVSYAQYMKMWTVPVLVQVISNPAYFL